MERRGRVPNRGAKPMYRRAMLVVVALSVMPTGQVIAQNADMEGVKAVSKAFYTALPVLDDGTVMESIWAKKPYVTYVGPRSTSIIVGWDAQKKYWESFNKGFSERSVSIVDSHIHVVGDLAWEIGFEAGQAKMSDGSARKVDWIVTNVYEKIDGHWLMVSHHVQPKPQ
jgi:ketosteroid isomerase-like protein